MCHSGLRISAILEFYANWPNTGTNVLTHGGSSGTSSKLKAKAMLTSPPPPGASAPSQAPGEECGLDGRAGPAVCCPMDIITQRL